MKKTTFALLAIVFVLALFSCSTKPCVTGDIVGSKLKGDGFTSHDFEFRLYRYDEDGFICSQYLIGVSRDTYHSYSVGDEYP